MRIVIRVEQITGRCPAYRVGDRIVLDHGFRLNLAETTAGCMHSFASMIPYHIALANGVRPEQMGLAHKDVRDGKAYVQCLDPCHVTGGGTVTFSMQVEED